MNSVIKPNLPENPLSQRAEYSLADILVLVLLSVFAIWAFCSLLQIIWMCNIRACRYQYCYNNPEEGLQEEQQQNELQGKD